MIGIGTDICGIERMKKTKEAFRKKCFTQAEREYAGERSDSLAGIFAAKEAFVKALGTGFSVFDFHAIEILHTEAGAPYYHLSGWAREAAEKLGAKNILLSISHDNGSAIAFCVIE